MRLFLRLDTTNYHNHEPQMHRMQGNVRQQSHNHPRAPVHRLQQTNLLTFKALISAGVLRMWSWYLRPARRAVDEANVRWGQYTSPCEQGALACMQPNSVELYLTIPLPI